MTRTRRRRLPGLCLALWIAGAAAAGLAQAATLRIASAFDPQTMDPHAVALLYHSRVVHQIHEPLVNRDASYALAPSLALSWAMTGSTSWRFKLRPGVKFHDGADFSADDVVFSIERALGPTSQRSFTLKGIAAVKKVDALTVDFVLNAPDAVLPDKLSNVPMVSQAWCIQHGVAKAQELTPQLLKTALSVADEQFPELLDLRFNQIPFTIFPLLPWNQRNWRDRFLLAGVLAELYRLSPEKQVQLVYDDALMATFAQHFLSQSGLSWMAPVVAVRGSGVHDGMPRMEMLSRALTTAVSHARDNEVFVVLADLLECTPSISHLLPAVKMVLARHHRVAFVCPTPTFRRPTELSKEIHSNTAEDLLFAAEQTRTRELSTRLQRELRRIGASVSFSGENNAIRLVLAEMEIARTGRRVRSETRR